MALARRVFLLVMALCGIAVHATSARAECGGSVQCISVGATPGEADTNHHGPSGTFTMAFGNQAVGTTSAARTAYVAAVTGPAGSMADLGIIFIDGPDASSFIITGGTCSDTNGPVHGGPQCTIEVAFNPLSAGSKTATVHVPLQPPICAGCVAERAFTVTGTGVTAAPAITSPLSASGTVGVTFSGYQITATNSPTSFGASALPPGLSVDASGFISGTPTTAGTFNSTITATNAGGTDSKTLVFTIHPPAPVITSPSSASGTGGQPFSYQITATNNPTNFAAASLPPGLRVNATTGLISGTPTQAGTFNATVSATNASGTGSQPVSFTISLAAPVVTSASSASATGGQPFSFQVTASNLPSSYGATGLPPGLTIDSASGLISGTPTAAGTFAATVTVSNSAGSGTQTLTITVALVPPVITSPGAVNGTAGQPLSYPITAANLPASFNASGLPAGLSVNTSTGLISGAPTAAGVFSVTVSATNSAGTGTQVVSFNIGAGAPAITSAGSAAGTVSQPFSYQITATNFPTSYGASGLPAGLSVNTATGLISGVPTSAGTFNVTVTASNAVGTGSQAVAMTFVLLPPVITSASSASGFVGQPFSFQVTATHLPTNFSATGLPAGLAMNAASGLISGTPATGGVFIVALEASNASGRGTGTLTLTIGSAPTPSAGNRSETVPFNTPVRIDLAPNILGSFTGVRLVTQPAHGTASVSGSAVTYTPASNYVGTDSFVYVAIGPGGESATATVSITVAPPPPPAAASRNVSVGYETPIAIDLADAVTGFYTALAITTAPRNGTVRLDGTVATYTPAGGFSGEDSFAFAATGPGGTSSPATVRITVGTVAPSARAASMTVQINTPATLDLRPFISGSGITRVAIASQPGRGRATANGTRVTYTPSQDLFGADSFTYVAIGNAGASAPATVTVTIVGRPDPTRDRGVTGLLESQDGAGRRFAAAQVANLQRRMESLHRGEPRPTAKPALGAMLASLGTSGSLELASLGHSAGSSRESTHFWMGGVAQFGQRDAHGSLGAFDFRTHGITLGADRRFGPHVVLGIGLGGARDKSEIGADGSTSKARGMSGALYGSFQPTRATFVDALVGFGRLEFEGHRFVTPIATMAASDRDGEQIFGSLAAGYEYRANGAVLAPYARLDYSRERLDAATETGAGPYALSYGGQSASALRAAIGARAEATLETRFGWSTPRVRAEYRRQVKGERTTAISYADLTDGPAFSFTSGPLERDGLMLGLGADFIFRGGLTIGLEYQAQRIGSGENDQSIRFNVSQELFGRGSLAWLDGLWLEPSRMRDIQVEAGIVYDDNVTRAISQADKRPDRSFVLNASKSWFHPLGPRTRAVVTASAGGEKFQYHEGLSRVTAGAKGELQYRPSAAFGSPTFTASAEAATQQFESRLRDGARYAAMLTARVPITDRLGLFGAVFHDRREARSDVFDARENGVRVTVDWATGPHSALYFMGEHRRGHLVTSADPLGAHTALKHDVLLLAQREVLDDAFRRPDLTTARFEGRSASAMLGFNFALGPRDALDISWRRVRSKPDDPADVVIGFYTPTPPVRYTVNQFSILYLLSF